jgi:hypothetical protein
MTQLIDGVHLDNQKTRQYMKHPLTALCIALLASSCLAQAASSPGPEAADTEVIAVVLGQEITAAEKDRLSGLVLGSLFREFAEENGIEPTDEEMDAFIERTEEMEKQHQLEWEADQRRLTEELEDPSLTDREREEKTDELETVESILETNREMEEQTRGMEEVMRPMKRRMARQFVMAWKINKAMHGKYGGRVIFQQAGPEPLDAYREFLEEQEEEGAFRIMDEQSAAEFWGYFTDDAMHTFYDEEDGDRFINTPWWLMEMPAEE